MRSFRASQVAHVVQELGKEDGKAEGARPTIGPTPSGILAMPVLAHLHQSHLLAVSSLPRHTETSSPTQIHTTRVGTQTSASLPSSYFVATSEKFSPRPYNLRVATPS